MKKICCYTVFLLAITCIGYAQKSNPTKIATTNQAFLVQLQTVSKSINIKKYTAPSKAQKEFIELFIKASKAATWSKKEYKAFMLAASRIVVNMGIVSDPDDGGEIFSDPDDGGEVFISPKKFIAAYNSLKPICTDVITRCQWKTL